MAKKPKTKKKTKKEKQDEFDARMEAYEKDAERRSAWGAYTHYCNSISGNNKGKILIG